MPPRKTASDTPKMLSTRRLVVINRDQTAATPRVVWAHEIPVLEAMFGEGNVRQPEPDTLDEGFSSKPSPEMVPFNKQQDPILRPSLTQGLGFVFCGNHRAEFDRLCSLYGMHPDVKEPYAENVFGRFNNGQFSRLVGEPELDDLPDDQLRALIKDYGYIPIEDPKGSDADRQVVRQKQKQLTNAQREELLAMAEEVGVQLV